MGSWRPTARYRAALLDPQTQIPVGRLIARLTFMKVLPHNNALVLGNADHHLDVGNYANAAGMISAQGSWRWSDPQPIFAIIGGTGRYEAARGTVTMQSINNKEQFTYNWH